MLLREVLPSLASELQELLAKKGESDLAEQVPALRIVDRCRCGDDFCASFYTEPKPKGAYGPTHRNVSLQPTKGMLILDVVEDRIANVEVLDRDEIKEDLQRAVP